MAAFEGCTSSSDTDSDEEERIRSVAVDSASISDAAALLFHKNCVKRNSFCQQGEEVPSALKFYQTRARDFLHAYFDRTFEVMPASDTIGSTSKVFEDSGFYLFKDSPSGLSEKERKQGTGRKRKLPSIIADENSELFRSRLYAATMDGDAVKLHAEKFKERARVLWTSQLAEEEKAKQEEHHRIAFLKLQRGELWLPSVARKGHAEM